MMMMMIMMMMIMMYYDVMRSRYYRLTFVLSSYLTLTHHFFCYCNTSQADAAAALAQAKRHSHGLQRELESSLLQQAQTNQRIVELRLRGLDFKAEVDRRGGRVLRSVETRLGFVPSAIHKQVAYLKLLKVGPAN